MSRSGDRHLRPDPENRLKSLRDSSGRVLIRANPEYAATSAGHHVLQMLANLLARQYGVVKEILVDVPSCAVRPDTFLLGPDAKGGLSAVVLNLIATVGGEEISGAPRENDEQAEVEILVGPGEPSPSTQVTVSVTADGWKFFCSTKGQAPATRGGSSNPNGPYIAACFAASSVFKFYFQTEPAIHIAGSLWDLVEGEWSELGHGQEPRAKLPAPVYMIGAGAVGTACAFTLAAMQEIEGTLIPIDPQSSDETSRNRLISCAYNETEVPKVDLLKTLFRTSQIDVFPYEGRWPDYTADGDRKTPHEIREIERNDRYEWVLSCVDKHIHRRAIAKYLPRNVIGGSTNGTTALIAHYAIESSFPCLGCYHPVPASIPTGELREMLVGMSLEQRLEWYRRYDASVESIDAMELYLKDPDCGTLGEAELAKLGLEGETDWSVGFVSVASGVILAAQLIRIAMLGTEKAIADQNEVFGWFWNSGIGRSVSRKKKGCLICGDSETKARYVRRWGGGPVNSTGYVS